MKITTNQILKITEEAIDKIGDGVGEDFRMNELYSVQRDALFWEIVEWCTDQGVEVTTRKKSVDEEVEG